MSGTILNCACVQTNTGPDVEKNLRVAAELVASATAAGATFVTLPEAVDLLDSDKVHVREHAVPLERHPAITTFSRVAKEGSAWVLIGSLAALNEHRRIVNRSVLLDPRGQIVCYYDKIHLFDVNLDPKDPKESDTYEPGKIARLARTPFGALGLSICYDLRFPQLYRALAKAGAQILTVPSAFMQRTGEAHWHVLLRARAIENGCYVVAPAQCGICYGSRRSFGHSLIIDPWGRILADAGDSEGVVHAQLDLSAVAKTRDILPCLTHDRAFEVAQS
jgi:deaminated glutathione amidase